MRLTRLLCAASLLLAGAFGQEINIQIPYERFVLNNGLTVIVHEDRKAPIVAVNVWYHVGSKNEKKGKTGFAHLFEHLMFNGSENFNQDYFKVLEKLGATDLNGTTNQDRTNYFQNVPTTALDTVLGGAFVSRINMNLREDKHWTYGARSSLAGARGQRPFYASAPVQSDKTKESMTEIRKELTEVLNQRPVTAWELEAAQGRLTLRLPGSRETMGAVASSIADLVQFGLPDAYYDVYPAKVRALSRQDIATAAEKLIRPDSLAWVVVGDRAKIEAGIREPGLGEIRYIDADGKAVQ